MALIWFLAGFCLGFAAALAFTLWHRGVRG